ncbi:MAG: HAMP domain-containing protein, partial [Deltaproteobacteria bacterium]|nr:HAMP domain-containing protein [Deltaproteobacteria bacterium]
IQILDNTGSLGQASVNLQSHPLPITLSALKKASNKEISFETLYAKESRYPVRMVTYPVVENNEVVSIIQIGTSLQAIQETLDKLLLILLFGVPASLTMASFGGWFMARKSLSPVKDITTAARMITARNLDRRIEVPNPDDEVGLLAATFNEMIARLNNSFRRINQFSSDVSHELRTPLTIIRGEMEIALRMPRTGEEYKAVIASGLEEVERMSAMVEELLLLSKAEAGASMLNLSIVPLHKLLDTIYNNANALAKGKGVDVTIQNYEEIYVNGDEMRLRQLFLNLVDNAIKYTPPMGKVAIVATQNSAYAHVSVTDTGIGIAKEDQEKIFERFYRVDKSRTRGENKVSDSENTEKRSTSWDVGGTGLGLAICKKIVKGHHGHITVESEIGKGSAFSVDLPLKHSTSSGRTVVWLKSLTLFRSW